MNVSATFIRRAVATTLLSIGVALAGVMAFRLLPVSPLPQVDFPTISVQASLPGASPEVMASTVATPLERALGRIAGVTEMTSGSSLGSTHITLQFDLNRDIDGAARDVQAAINAARSLLPSGMPANPTYRKVNPADAPIMILALTSRTLTRGQMYDSASTVLAQKIAQLKGVGQVTVGGSALPAVRVALNPTALNHYGISLEQVRTALASANANRPKGSIEFGDRHWQILASDQALHAADYPSLLVAYRNGRPVRLSDIATVSDSVENVRNAGMSSGQPAVLLIVFRQPGANIIDTVDGIRAAMPRLRAEMPAAIDIDIANDRTPTIRASLRDVERTLMISIALVVMVVFLFLRHGRATLIPSAAVPVSLLGTFCVMYLAGFSLNNLSLMALTVATGFVVDDAVVVLENITRHIEGGMKPMAAALQGAREVGFTVISMSLSLVAVFIPILMMGGIIGRLFREFAVTLSAAILVSLVVSLTLTPMMCSRLLKGGEGVQEGRFQRWSESLFTSLHAGYRRSLDWALRHSVFMTVVLMATIALNIFLYVIVPKGFFPQQDTGRLMGSIQADQGISFQAMQQKLKDFMGLVAHDRDVASVVGFTGGGQTNSGNMFIALRPLSERSDSADAVIARLRARTAREPGARLFLQTVQDIRMGGRPSQAQYQYTLQSDDLGSLNEWAPRLTEALQKSSVLLDVNSDQQEGGQQTRLTYDRDMLAQLGLTVGQVDATLNDAFGQRQVSTIYMPLNQYHVVMELAPAHTQRAESLNDIYLVGKNGTAVPLAAMARAAPAFAPLSVNHQGQFVATTLSFNLPPGKSLTEAGRLIDETAARIGMPANVHGGFQGNAKAFQDSLATMPLLILAALLTMYIVLGVLYESYVHPVTILSTLPSAGVGALLALMAFHTEFSIIALIGVLLLVGIVKKNAIMMIDVALDAQRHQGLAAKEAIRHACLLRFRPIMMTTMAALFGAVPLALGHGDGAELRQPLGIAVVGGLLVSQLLTLYTTPIVFVGLDNFRRWCLRRMGKPDHAGVVGAGL